MTRHAPNRPRGAQRIFAVPAVLFVISLFGLVASLLSDGWPDVVLALLAGSGIAAIVWSLLQRRP